MELIEKLKSEITTSDQTNWWMLLIEAPGNADDPNFSLIEQWRSLYNSTKGIGLSNRVWIRRYINGSGYWIRYTDGETDRLMVFFQSNKELEKTGFLKHMIIRYYSSCRRKPIMTLTFMKPSVGDTLYNLMHGTITKQINKVFESNRIPVIKMSKFGDFWNKIKQ